MSVSFLTDVLEGVQTTYWMTFSVYVYGDIQNSFLYCFSFSLTRCVVHAGMTEFVT